MNKVVQHVFRSMALALLFGAMMLFASATMPHTQAASKTTLADLPVAAQALVSKTLGQENAAYQFQATADGYQLANASELRADFSNAGMRLQLGDAQWTLALQSIGYGDALQAVTQVAPTAMANRLEYARNLVTEWFVNGPAGLEQGWTLTSPPAPLLRGEGGALTLALALNGNARLNADGKSVAFLQNDGAVAVNYAGLTAYDATGRELRAWMEMLPSPDRRGVGGEVAIRVDDTDAQYPLTIDPYVLQATLTNASGAGNDQVGFSIAMSADGSTIVTGAYRVSSDTGAAYVFVKSGSWATTGAPIATLTNSSGVASDNMGYSVAISADGSTIIVGADGVSSFKGAAYVFVKPGGGWATTGTPNAKLTNSGSANSDEFGDSVATNSDGSTVVVGAPFALSNKGAAYVYVKSGSWATTSSPNATLSNSSGTNDRLGNSVAISGDGATIVAGAYRVSSSQGAAYVYVKSGSWATTGTPTATLTNSGGAASDYLGGSVAVSSDGSTIVTGASGVSSSKGAAYVFVKSGSWATTGTPNATLTNSGGAANDQLGYSVALSSDGSSIVAGAPFALSSKGVAYVFAKSGSWATTGTPTATLTNASGVANDQMGYSVALNSDGSTIVTGARGVSSYKGAAYVFVNVKTATTTTLTGPSGSFTGAQSFTFNATVAGAAAAPAKPGAAKAPSQTGTVTFYDNNVTIPACASVTLNANHQATCTVTLQPATHVIRAHYNGDTTYAESDSNSLTLNGQQAPSDVPEGDTLLLLGGGMSGLGVWLRYQWSKRKGMRK